MNFKFPTAKVIKNIDNGVVKNLSSVILCAASVVLCVTMLITIYFLIAPNIFQNLCQSRVEMSFFVVVSCACALPLTQKLAQKYSIFNFQISASAVFNDIFGNFGFVGNLYVDFAMIFCSLIFFCVQI